MPSLERIRSRIKEADVIILDDDLSTSYEGRDLLPDCQGKMVVGTSTRISLGTVQFTDKNNFYPRTVFTTGQKLRDLVLSQVDKVRESGIS